MDLTRFGSGFRRKTVVVLGAGATRGYTFAGDPNFTSMLPPLDADFFSELQRIPGGRYRQVDRLLEFVREEFDPGLNVSLERFFTEVEFTDRFHRTLQVDSGRPIQRYRTALEDFYVSLPLSFEESGLRLGSSCIYHDALADALEVNDAVISFNYDCLMDAALQNTASTKWKPKTGYGVPMSFGTKEWEPKAPRGRHYENEVLLLKPHGSLNWERTGSKVGLTAEPYKGMSARGRIIPPFLQKDVFEPPFIDVWKRARTALRTVKALIVVGYSFPQADPLVRALFRTELAAADLDLLVVVNPSQEDRRRAISLLAPGISRSTRILQLESFAQLHQRHLA